MTVTYGLAAVACVLLACNSAAARSKRQCGDSFEIEETIRLCTQTIQAKNESKRNRAIAYNNRCFAYVRKGDLKRALADCNKGIETDPDLDLTYAARAEIWYQEKKWDRAIQDFNQAIHLEPKDMDNLFGRAKVYAAKGDHDRAIDDYTHVLTIDPKLREAFHNRGYMYLQKKDYPRALEDFTKAIEIEPTVTNLTNRAIVYNRTKDHRRALDDASAAMKLDPKECGPYFQLSRAKTEMGDKAGGSAEFQKAFKMGCRPSSDDW
jgi:tetratricopeptide (TPR) repeat protein